MVLLPVNCSLYRAHEGLSDPICIESGGARLNLFPAARDPRVPRFLHPVAFVGAFTLLGMLFALQEWVSLHSWNNHIYITLQLVMTAWCVHYSLWGVICWLLWWRLRQSIQRAGFFSIVTRFLPLSVAVSVIEEMIWVAIFPQLPLGLPRMTYWHRVVFHLDAELVDNLVIFWSAFFFLRGVGYYQLYRETEYAAVQLETQFANAQLRALRMQLNPHFLFNTMNSISSLMQTDIVAADRMLEQLCSLLRITLERGDVQLIPLSDEMEFIEMYLAMQDRRFTGRVRQEICVEPDLYDALVPSMLLQPVIENAYTHGLSRLEQNGLIVVDVRRQNERLVISVVNSGLGLRPAPSTCGERRGVGLANVKDRMRLHYGSNQAFNIEELTHGKVRVTITLPLQFSERPTEKLTGYGV
jgi:two-component system LytT family sensor kinase